MNKKLNVVMIDLFVIALLILITSVSIHAIGYYAEWLNINFVYVALYIILAFQLEPYARKIVLWIFAKISRWQL